VERRSGKYFGAVTALRQILLATGGTLTLKRSGKSRRTRSVDPQSVYFLAQIAPKRGIWHQKSQKISGGDTPDPLSERWRPPPTSTPSMATRCAQGHKLSRCWDLGLGNRSPKSKFTTTPRFQLSLTLFFCAFSALTLLAGQQEEHPMSDAVPVWLSVRSEVTLQPLANYVTSRLAV